MDISALYDEFKEAGRQPCGLDDPDKGRRVAQYRKSGEKLYAALMEWIKSGGTHSDLVDSLLNTISKAERKPEEFFGSEKMMNFNQNLFLYDKKERLFLELLRMWEEVHVGR